MSLHRTVLVSAALLGAFLSRGQAELAAAATDPGDITVAPQYSSTHVYVAPERFDRLVASLVATFDGSLSPKTALQVTPTPSQTNWKAVTTPVGLFSVFGFTTPIPYPFGQERTGYLVTDMDLAVKSAKRHGADIQVAPFPDPIGRDALIEWPGGVHMQLYWHTKAPNSPALKSVPENRVYVSPEHADEFIADFLAFAHGNITSNEPRAAGIGIGRPGETYRRVRLESNFGKITVLVTNGHLPFPYGRELMGFEVANLGVTLCKAETAGVKILVHPYNDGARQAALVQFPGGYIAEIHATAPQ